tara:strand:- start:3873 stop:4820 length:948 start_codon:yes stop_codon:yes gene_type:complete
MVQIHYKPYKFLVTNIVLKREIFIKDMVYYPIKYKTKSEPSNWVIQTPLMFLPFAMSSYEGNNNYLDLSFLSHENDQDLSKFLKFVIKTNNIFKNKKTFSKYTFKNSLKDKTSMFPERLRVNYNKKNNILVFNEENNPIDITSLKGKMYGKFLLQITNIWVNKGRKEYGLIWNISQIKLSTNLIYSPDELAFLEDEIEEVPISPSNPEYKPYFFMKKIGLDIKIVKHKLIKDNLDPGIADIIFEIKPNTKEHYSTVKKPPPLKLNFLGQINGSQSITSGLKKITIVKRKTKSPKNSLVPSQEDIQSALSRLRKTE